MGILRIWFQQVLAFSDSFKGIIMKDLAGIKWCTSLFKEMLPVDLRRTTCGSKSQCAGSERRVDDSIT